MSHNSVLIGLTMVLFLGLPFAQEVSSQTSPPRVFVWAESLSGTEEDEVRWPVAVAAPSVEEFAVAEAFEPRLLVFRKVGVSWQLSQAIALPGTPHSLTHDGSRYLVSLREGKGLSTLAGPKLAQRRIALPEGVIPGPLAALKDGSVVVYDFAGRRVIEVESKGSSPRELPISEHVTGIAATHDGGFAVALGAKGQVLRYDATWELTKTIELPANSAQPAWPSGLATSPGGELTVLDKYGGRILVFDSEGRWIGLGSRRGWEPGLLLHPVGSARLPDGSLVVADQGNNRIQIFKPTSGDS